MEGRKEEPVTAETFLNRLNDTNAEWWPFGCLRPEPHERLTLGHALSLALLYGVPAATLMLVIGSLTGDVVHLERGVAFVFSVCAGAFVLLQFAVVRSWNRRAAKLQPIYQRRVAWQKRHSSGRRRLSR